jgi:hypothetical protein
MVVSVRVVGVALSTNSKRLKQKLRWHSNQLPSLPAPRAEAHVAGSGYEATAAALGPTIRALSTSKGLGFAHFGALAGVGKGKRVSTACKCFTEFRLWLRAWLNKKLTLDYLT